jgi:hypothetical protein
MSKQTQVTIHFNSAPIATFQMGEDKKVKLVNVAMSLEEDKEFFYNNFLEKAQRDIPWDYAMGLRNGCVIRFNGARLRDKEWIHLLGVGDNADCSIEMSGVKEVSFERGLDVRISDILWVVDAPNGS